MSIRIIRLILTVLFLLCYLPLSASAEIDPNAFFVDKDHPDASDSNLGTATAPWKTIQHGVNQLFPGARLYIRESVEPYFEPYRMQGLSTGGITIDVAGTPDAWIYIEGYPGERPVINQKRARSSLNAKTGLPDDPTASKVLTGLYLQKADYMVIKNLEITQTSASGIYFNQHKQNNYVIVEDNHIHHLYGADNTGGIRLDFADNITIRNNVIHDIYDIRIPIRVSNPYTSEPYGMHSGIHGYEPADCIIENNLIFNVGRGIFAKKADSDNKNAHIVRRNIFYNIGHSALALDISSVAAPPAINAKFYENIVYDSIAGVRSTLLSTSSQSIGMYIYNNTFHNVDEAINLRGQTGIEIYNNIFSSIKNVDFSTSRANGNPIKNEIKYFDHNLYYINANLWILERYDTNTEYFRSFNSWRQAYSQDQSQGVGLLVAPDQNSLIGDPFFIDLANNNFRLQQNSPAHSKGRNGEDMGAYKMISTILGPTINVNLMSQSPGQPTSVKVE